MSHKNEVDLGRYPKLFEDQKLLSNGRNAYLQKFIDATIIQKANQFFWQEHFRKDTTATPLPKGKGYASFTVQNIKRTLATLPEFHTPYSEVSQADTDGFSEYQGTIPQLAHGIYETSMTREELEAIVEETGSDKDIMEQTQDNILKKRNGFHFALSNMVAQIMSTSKIIGWRGVAGVPYSQHALIPVENILTESTAWSSVGFDLPARLEAIEKAFRDRTGFEGLMEWNIDDVTIKNVFLTNEKMSKRILAWRLATGGTNGVIIVNGENPLQQNIVTEEMLVAYSQWAESGISPIKVMREYQSEQKLTGRSGTRGWKVGNAVLRPIGYAGVIKYSEVRDIVKLRKEASPGIIFSTSSMDGGLIQLANIIRGDGLYRQYHSNLYMAATPALEEFEQHIIVDTKTGGA